MNLDPSLYYVRSENNEPRLERDDYYVWLADEKEKKFLRNPKLAELMQEYDGALWGRDADARIWHRLHDFDSACYIVNVALKHLLFHYGLDHTITDSWGFPDAKVRLHSVSQYAEWEGNRFYWAEDTENQVICTHIFWCDGYRSPELNDVILGQDFIRFLEWNNILEW